MFVLARILVKRCMHREDSNIGLIRSWKDLVSVKDLILKEKIILREF